MNVFNKTIKLCINICEIKKRKQSINSLQINENNYIEFLTISSNIYHQLYHISMVVNSLLF